MTKPASYKRHRFPPQIIAHAVWLYFRFPLSLRFVEEMLLERGVVVSYKTIRRWALKFGPEYARRVRRKQPCPHDVWHLDEVVISIAGKKHGSVATPDIGQTEARQGRWLRGCTEQGGNEASLSAHVIG